MSSGQRLLGRAFDLTVYAPIGLTVELSRCATRVMNGVQRRAADRIVVVRTVGQLAIQVGGRRLREMFAETDVAVATHPAGPAPAAVAPLRALADAAPVSKTEAVVADLPIDEYESLAASQVVARLTALDTDELTLIEQFERANRRRRTVLGKIEQLQRA